MKLMHWMVAMTTLATGHQTCLAQTGAAQEVTLRGNTLYYLGPLSPERNNKAYELYQAASVAPTKLAITSEGGDIELGMALGRWVFDRQLDVEVQDYCMSSCANYVFPAGRVKYLHGNAVVGYHGGAFSKLAYGQVDYQIDPTLDAVARKAALKQLKAQRRAYRKTAKVWESAFYQHIGVDKRLPTLGEAPAYAALLRQHWGWTYPPQDFVKLGVNRVVVVAPPWSLRPLPPGKSLFVVRVLH